MMDNTTKFWLVTVLVAVVAYLIGSVSFAVIVSRLGAQDDVRAHGSGNAGMTNILRNYGKKLAVFTAVGDFGKGIVAVLLGRMFFSLVGFGGSGNGVIDGGYIAGFFVVVGHLFPLYFGFRGGKGVLTSAGVMLVLNPIAMLILLAIDLPLVFLVKIVSLASVTGYFLYPIIGALVDTYLREAPVRFNLLFAILICGIGLVMHRENIKRLLKGTEYRFGKKDGTKPNE